MPTYVSRDTRPAHLYRRNRPIDPNFETTELLYRRCPPSAIVAGQVTSQAFTSTNVSVSRSKHGGQPEDARWVSEEEVPPNADGLVPLYSDEAVVAVAVGAIPPEIARPTGGPFTLRPEHVPYEDHYLHSEVRVYRGTTLMAQSRSLPALIKSKIRQELAARAFVVLTPSEHQAEPT